MGPVYFVMAIMGCGDGSTGCTEARIHPVRYATAAECLANQNAVLARSTDLAFPVISTTCRRTGLQVVSADTNQRG